ncbi:hypothetical protein FF098_014825 [Parvularcula flava]|uniref:Uncharacterized protein n=1 Tax=Aquisalinus luteolus TaxID=1566827 RepID=A0A8J3A592_9PROT|nr:phage tail terminator-like protein [Aquisalinus luteolus]NHK29192.1 hypothetical protein [Aquisalinus luteolus]GGI00021.1 hypothetical protein GCM10011355_27330 [Aquisalinus luteolus]
MATGPEAVIADLLLEHMDGLTTTPATDKAWGNVDHKRGTKDYLEVAILPVRSEVPALAGVRRARGILQVTVAVKRNRGIVKAMELVSQVCDHCPSGTLLQSGDICVRFNSQSSPTAPLVERDEIRIPVSIPYQSLIEEGE